MQPGDGFDKPLLFAVKKWLLVALCALSILIMLIYASVSGLLAEHYLYDFETIDSLHIEETKVAIHPCV